MRNYNRTSIFNLAWQFIKKNGMTLSEALKVAWANAKVKNALHRGITHFRFFKVDGSIREAYGTLDPHWAPEPLGLRTPAPSVQTYWDTEKSAWRCFKRVNLIGLA